MQIINTQHIKNGIALFGLALSFSLVSASGSFYCNCVGVTDGDTISVMHNGRAVKVRLEGIDCPETGHDFSNTAKKFTSALVYGRTVEVHQTDTDGYGRILGVVFADGFESGDATKWSSTVP